MRIARIWYVIADGGRARFVERDDKGAFRTRDSFVSSELHDRSSDLGTERPSRVRESANAARHAIEPKRDLHDAAKQDFVKFVAGQLEAEKANFDEVVLVAPPRVLGQFRETMSKALAKTVVRDLPKDLTKIEDHELSAHLLP